MQEGTFRCDANVSVRPAGRRALGTRCEIKNLNSFRFMQQAIEYEVRRQIELIEDGGTGAAGDALYDPDRNETRADAQQGRRAGLPLLPRSRPAAARDRRRRGSSACAARCRSCRATMRGALRQRDYGCRAYDARGPHVSSKAMARATSRRSSQTASGQRQAGRQLADGRASRRAEPRATSTSARRRVAPAQLALLVSRIADGTISNKIAQGRLRRAVGAATDDDVDAHHRAPRACGRLRDTGALEAIVDEVLAANPKSVEEFRAGKEKAFNALVGQAMKATKGKANPAQVNALLRAQARADRRRGRRRRSAAAARGRRGRSATAPGRASRPARRPRACAGAPARRRRAR